MRATSLNARKTTKTKHKQKLISNSKFSIKKEKEDLSIKMTMRRTRKSYTLTNYQLFSYFYFF